MYVRTDVKIAAKIEKKTIFASFYPHTLFLYYDSKNEVKIYIIEKLLEMLRHFSK